MVTWYTVEFSRMHLTQCMHNANIRVVQKMEYMYINPKEWIFLASLQHIVKIDTLSFTL